MVSVHPQLAGQPYLPEVLDYYAKKVHTSVLRTLGYCNAPGDCRWVRNFTCRRFGTLGMFGTRTRYPDALKTPALRQAIVQKAKDAYAEYGYDVQMSMAFKHSLGLGGSSEEVGSGYELLATFVKVPKRENDETAPVKA